MTNRYAVPAIEAIWDQHSVYSRWLRVSRAVLVAARTHALIPPVSLQGFPTRFDEIDLQLVSEREAEVGHDVVAFLDVLRNRLEPGDLAPWLHFGLTSSNLVDTGLVLACGETSRELHARARTLIDRLGDLPAVPRASRTHGQLAEASNLGRQAQAWAARVRSAESELHEAEARLTISLGGPTGRYETFTYPAAQSAARELGLRLEVDSEQAVRRDAIARWGRAVADLTTAAAHFALQVRLGARDGELAEPTGVSSYRGSSSMAFKRNPTRSERICGLERVTRALAGALDADVIWWDQRDISASSVERVVLPQLSGLAAFCLGEAAAIAGDLVIDVHACHEHLEAIPEPASALWERVAAGASHEAAYEAAWGSVPPLASEGDEGASVARNEA